MKILITRHGQTDWNLQKKVQGRADIPLNENGKNEAKEIHEKLKDEKIDLIISSPLNRARETSELIRGNREIPIILDERIIERSFGINEGKNKKDFEFYDFWDYEKNIDTTPDKVTLGSDYKAWWKCAKGHSYQSAVSNRVAGKGCPICSGHRIVSGINDLVTANPGLAVEWHSEKNTDDPHTVSPNSKKKVWWKCSICGNEWQAEIHSRNSGVGCPICARKRVTEGQRKRALLKSGTLAEKNPQLSSQWHPTRNQNMTPERVTPGCDYKAWWLCPDCGHEWSAAVGSRNRGHGCPRCSKRHK